MRQLWVFAQIKLFESAGGTDKMFKLGELCHIKLPEIALAALKVRKLFTACQIECSQSRIVKAIYPLKRFCVF